MLIAWSRSRCRERRINKYYLAWHFSGVNISGILPVVSHTASIVTDWTDAGHCWPASPLLHSRHKLLQYANGHINALWQLKTTRSISWHKFTVYFITILKTTCICHKHFDNVGRAEQRASELWIALQQPAKVFLWELYLNLSTFEPTAVNSDKLAD